MKKFLFIEGTSVTTNGDLRITFGKLFEKKLKGKMPRIIMGNSVNKTIDKFNTDKTINPKFLLIDLDAPKNKKNNKITEYNLKDKQKCVFFMIQEMEAWFLSQPELLDSIFKSNISEKIRNKNSEEIEKPSKLLQELTNGKYHKVKSATKLLPRLDPDKLIIQFEDFKNLIKELKK